MSKDIEKVIFLDYKRYPNSDLALELLKNKYVVDILDMEKELDNIVNLLINPGIYFFTLVPEYKEAILSFSLNHKSLLDFLNEEDLINLKTYISRFPELKISRMKLNNESIDPLTLASLYNESPSLSVKIQTSGIPLINRYNGMDSFLAINELTAGLVTPATQSETDSILDESYIDNHDYIVQAINNEFYMIKVTERTSNNLTWYEVTEMPLPDYVNECLKGFNNMEYYFMYLRSLKTFKISAIFSGINYHINPKLYIKPN